MGDILHGEFPDLRDGVDGQELEDYEWDPATGLGWFTYYCARTRTQSVIARPQPYYPEHATS